MIHIIQRTSTFFLVFIHWAISAQGTHSGHLCHSLLSGVTCSSWHLGECFLFLKSSSAAGERVEPLDWVGKFYQKSDLLLFQQFLFFEHYHWFFFVVVVVTKGFWKSALPSFLERSSLRTNSGRGPRAEGRLWAVGWAVQQIDAGQGTRTLSFWTQLPSGLAQGPWVPPRPFCIVAPIVLGVGTPEDRPDSREFRGA